MSNVLKITHNGKVFLVARRPSNLTTVNDLYLSKNQREKLRKHFTEKNRFKKKNKKKTRMMFSRVTTKGY